LYLHSFCCLLVIAVVPEPVTGDAVEGKAGDASAERCDRPSELEVLRARIQFLEEENTLLRRSMVLGTCCLPHPDSDVEGDPLHYRHPGCHALMCPCFMQEATEVISELCSRLGRPVTGVSVGDSASAAPLSGTDEASSPHPHAAFHDCLRTHEIALERALCLARTCLHYHKDPEVETPEQAAVRGLMLKGYEFQMRKYGLRCCRSCFPVPLHVLGCVVSCCIFREGPWVKPTCLSPPVFMKTPGGCATKFGVRAKLFSIPGVHSVISDDKLVDVLVWNDASVHAVYKVIVDEFTPFTVGTAPPLQCENQFGSGDSYGDRCRFDQTFCQDRSATCAFVVEHESAKYAATARHAVFRQNASHTTAEDGMVHSPSPAIDEVTPPVVVANSFEVFNPPVGDYPGDFAMFRLKEDVVVPAQFGCSVQDVVATAAAALKPGTVLHRVGAVTGGGNATVIRGVASQLPPMASPPAYDGHLVSLEVGSTKGDSGGPYISTDTNIPAAVHKASVTVEQVLAASLSLPALVGDHHLAVVETCEVLEFFDMPESRVL
jgi:hypothetical protein